MLIICAVGALTDKQARDMAEKTITHFDIEHPVQDHEFIEVE